MHPSTSPTPTAPTPSTESASRHPEACAAAPHRPNGVGACQPASTGDVSAVRPELNLRCRVQRVERDLHCGRAISDQDLLQHSKDCTFLMEASYDRFLSEDSWNPCAEQHRQEAMRWMHQRDHALLCLSPEWKAAREAQIQRDIAQGTGCFFLDAADRARAANERSAG